MRVELVLTCPDCGAGGRAELAAIAAGQLEEFLGDRCPSCSTWNGTAAPPASVRLIVGHLARALGVDQ